MEDISGIRDMYDAQWEREDSRLTRHQLERDITWRYLEKYLPAGGRILEIGSATGNYTLELAKRGYKVTAVDISPNMVSGTQARVREAGLEDRVSISIGDGRVLAGVPENEFNAALMMGPLYHLQSEEERMVCLRRVFACLKPGGILFSAMISRYGVLGQIMEEKPELILNPQHFDSHLKNGREPEDFEKRGFHGYCCVIDEIRPLHEAAGFQTMVIAGAEPAISADDGSYNGLTGEVRQGWLDLLFRISTEPSMIASSRHLLYIGRKMK